MLKWIGGLITGALAMFAMWATVGANALMQENRELRQEKNTSEEAE